MTITCYFTKTEDKTILKKYISIENDKYKMTIYILGSQLCWYVVYLSFLVPPHIGMHNNGRLRHTAYRLAHIAFASSESNPRSKLAVDSVVVSIHP